MKRPASLVAAILFFLMAIGQLLRFVLDLDVVAAGKEIPAWFSAVAAWLLALLGIWLLAERKRK